MTNNKKFVLIIMFIQLLSGVVNIYNINIIRYFINFILFLLIPGLLIYIIFNLDLNDLWNILTFSLFSSISILFIISILLNEILSIIGVLKPLLNIYIWIVYNIIIFILMLFMYFYKDKLYISILSTNLEIFIKLFIILLFPFISIIGALYVNIYNSNIILMILILLIGISFFTLALLMYKNKINSSYYPYLLFSITFSLILHNSLITNYIYGHDIHSDIFIFNIHYKFNKWISILPINDWWFSDANAMLSISILPVVLSNILNISCTWIYKIIYPLIYSLTIIITYNLFKIKFDKNVSFISCLFLISNFVFYAPIYHAKQMIAIPYFCLISQIIFIMRIKPLIQTFYFIIFSFTLITSHHGTAYYYLILIIMTWIYVNKTIILDYTRARSINFSYIIIFATILSIWYINVSNAGAFRRLIVLKNTIFNNFIYKVLNIQTRGQTVIRGLGLEFAQNIYHTIARILHLSTEIFILIGFLNNIMNRNENEEQSFNTLISLNMIFLLISILIPGIAFSFRIERIYNLVLFYLSPFFIIGGRTLLTILLSRKKEIYDLLILCGILIPFFFFQNGFIYEIVKDDNPYSIPLSMYRMGQDSYNKYGVVPEIEVSGALWLSKNSINANIYSDFVARHHVLLSYGLINWNSAKILSNRTSIQNESLIFFRKYNTLMGKIIERQITEEKFIEFNCSDIPLNNYDKIFSNSGSEIYKN